MRTANPHENTKQPRLPRLTPLTHPQPVSPLQQQRPLVGDGLRLLGWRMEGDKFCFVLAEIAHVIPAEAKRRAGTPKDIAAWGLGLG
jgi:hypothetical protein